MKKTSLVDATVESSTVTPGTIKKTVTKIMKIVMIETTPETRIANLQLTRITGGPVALEIDEATARAIAKVFD